MGDFTIASRRQFLGSRGAAGVSMLLPASGLAQRSAVLPARKGLIDVHHHIGPPRNTGQRGGGGSANWSPARAVEEMDRNGVATGIGYPGPVQSTLSDFARGRRHARELNEYGTQIAGDYRGRFGLFAALPVADVDGSLKEIEYALDVLKADGFGIATSYGVMWLGDSKLRPIWAELNRRKAVVYVHPSDDRCCTPSTLTYEKQGISGPWLEWPVNTARTILSLMTNGITTEFP